MISHPNRFRKAAIGTTAALAALMLASCVTTPRSSSPQQVAESNPTVTYKYRNDDELIQANQRAVTFCNQHQALPQPRAESFSVDANGDRIVVFECLPGTSVIAATPLRQPNSDLSYSFRTDQELLNASREAQVHCLNNGSPEMDSNIVTHSNGTKTVTFRCSG
jgi:hypothetical protein